MEPRPEPLTDGAPRQGGRVVLSRATVIAEGRAMIDAEGLDQLSLRRLAERLGVTAPALYKHVAGKDDLVAAVADAELDAMVAMLSGLDADTDPVVLLRTFARAYVRHGLRHPHLYRTLFLRPPAAGPGAGPGIPTAKVAVLLDAVARASADGRFRPMPPVAGFLVLWTALHGLVEVLLYGVVTEPATQRQLADDVLDTVLAGLAVPHPSGVLATTDA